MLFLASTMVFLSLFFVVPSGPKLPSMPEDFRTEEVIEEKNSSEEYDYDEYYYYDYEE